VHAGADSHADYSSAGDTRVVNSRFASYSGKATYGFRKNGWTSTNSILASLSQFGFVFDSLAQDVDDDRLSRTFQGPHHTVVVGMFSTENTIYGNRVKWKLNGGWISNRRQEQEGGNKISLDMLLNTASVGVQESSSLGEKGTWTNGGSFMFQTNTNIGSRVIVPDATTLEASVFTLATKRLDDLTLEAGLRFDWRSITAIRTLTLDRPFDNAWTTVNGSVGLAWDPVEALNIKANVSSGYRSGNLAELGSDGLHEGTHRWEIGDPYLDIEQNFCAEGGFTYEWNEQLRIGGSVYRNAFNDYIYLTPTGTETLGFPIYRYVQGDAVLQGGEAMLDIHPTGIKWLNIDGSFSHVEGELNDGSLLPFIPADRLSVGMKLVARQRNWFRIGLDQVFEQDKPAQFETATPAYLLWNASAGLDRNWNGRPLEIMVVCNNLTDEQYSDHLSRFKYFGLYDIGRNVIVSMHLSF
jgi:iron complex outermembrane receptor protein